MRSSTQITVLVHCLKHIFISAYIKEQVIRSMESFWNSIRIGNLLILVDYSNGKVTSRVSTCPALLINPSAIQVYLQGQERIYEN